MDGPSMASAAEPKPKKRRKRLTPLDRSAAGYITSAIIEDGCVVFYQASATKAGCDARRPVRCRCAECRWVWRLEQQRQNLSWFIHRHRYPRDKRFRLWIKCHAVSAETLELLLLYFETMDRASAPPRVDDAPTIEWEDRQEYLDAQAAHVSSQTQGESWRQRVLEMTGVRLSPQESDDEVWQLLQQVDYALGCYKELTAPPSVA